MDRSSALRYLAACYQADHRQPTLWDMLGDKVAHAIVLERDPVVLTGQLNRMPVQPAAEAFAAAQTAMVYRKERWLACGVFFVCGQLDLPGQGVVKARAPLVLLPAEITGTGDVAELSVDLASAVLNQPLMDLLCGEPGRALDLAQALYGEVLGDAIGATQVAALHALVREHLPQVDPSGLSVWPAMSNAAALQRARSAAKLTLWPAAAVGVVARSTETRGVLSELATLAEASNLSRPLRQLLQPREASSVERDARRGDVPAELSAAQRAVLDAAASEPMTLMIGPPGTGKSFTSAALAIEHLSRGERVLVASRMDHAVDVIAGMIRKTIGLPGCIVRGGRGQQLRELRDDVDALLQNNVPPPQIDGDASPRVLDQGIRLLERQIVRLERELKRQLEMERQHGRFLSQHPTPPPIWSLPDRLRSAWIRWRVPQSCPPWKNLHALQEAIEQRNRLLVQRIALNHHQRLVAAVREHRQAFMKFRKAITARTSGRQEALFSELDWDVLLRALPIWLVTLGDVHEVLPLTAELFDVVIIDEASQCDLASSLPCLHRAKRAVISGDPRQLRHVSFVSRDQQAHLAELQGLPGADRDRLSYRDRSLLDLSEEAVTTGRAVATLDEHFRSVPAIIRFSNARFYGDRLRVMTQRPGDTPSGTGVFIHRIANGQRAADGTNPAEAGALLQHVRDIAERERDLTPAARHSIGILSPFRAQVDLLRDRLLRELPDVVGPHDVMVGTAHTFQGEERDVMLLSMVVDATSPHGSFLYLDKADVFNVAITRARLAQHVFCSLEPEDIRFGTLLRDYLLDARRSVPVNEQTPAAVRDRFVAELVAWAEDEGVQSWVQYPVAGLPIDVLLRHGDRVVGVDLIGYPSPLEEAWALQRLRLFGRAGLPILPMPWSRWHLQRSACEAAIREALRVVDV